MNIIQGIFNHDRITIFLFLINIHKGIDIPRWNLDHVTRILMKGKFQIGAFQLTEMDIPRTSPVKERWLRSFSL